MNQPPSGGGFPPGHPPGYPQQPGQPAPQGGPQGYPQQPAYPGQPVPHGYPHQQAYPQQPGYPSQPGYPQHPGHPQQPWGQAPMQPYGGGMQMNPAGAGAKGQIRPLFTMWLLWAATCGIYGVWWYFAVANEINTFLGQPRMSAGKLLGLSAITCGIYGLYFVFVDGKEIIKEVQMRAGLPPKAPLIAGPLQIQGALNRVWTALP